MSINLRFKKIIDDVYSGNKRAFAIAIGVAPTVVENVVGTRQGNPSFEVLQKVLRANEGINAEWLVTGNGLMFKKSKESKDIKVFEMKTDRKRADQQIPLYDIRATASIITLFDDSFDQNPVDYISIPNFPASTGAIYVTGDSMYPLMKSGDIVIYKKLSSQIDNIFWGEMYLLQLNIEGDIFITIKWVQKSEEGGDYVKLVSENRHHQPKDVHVKYITGIALVKGLIRVNNIV